MPTAARPDRGSIADPALDRYVYAGDSPVDVTDASGRGWWTCRLSTAALGLGLFASGLVQLGAAVALAIGGAALGPPELLLFFAVEAPLTGVDVALVYLILHDSQC